MKLSIIVTTYNRPDDLVECLQSIRAQFDPPEQVVVVDDGNFENTQRRLADVGFENTELIAGPNDGLPAARNRGVKQATGDVIAFIDDDVILPPNWTRKLMQTYQQYPDVVGVGGCVVNQNPPGINKANIDTFSYRAFQALRTTLFYHKLGRVSPVGILWVPHTVMTSEIRRVDCIQGCNMSFKTEIFEEYSFDEWYGETGSSAGEEADFCFRITSESNDLLYNPRVTVLHKRSLSTDDERAGSPNYGNITNLTYLVLKHPDMGLSNLLLLVIGIVVYSILNRDFGFLRAVKKGIVEYRKQVVENGTDR